MLIILLIILALFSVYVLMTRCRSGHPMLSALQGWAYAHRGLHGNGVPENSMKAFRLAKEAGYGIEFDVHLLADGNLAVIHDASLKRTANEDLFIEDLTADQLSRYYLEGTDETIPLFQDVLDLYSGCAPLIIELKAERNNAAELCKTVCSVLENYSGIFCVESFDPRCIMWLKKNRPKIIRGQLAENYFASPNSKLPWYLKLVLSWHMLNFITLPDFISYRFRDRKCFGNYICRKVWGAQGVTWTLKSKEDFDVAAAEDWIPIFENFQP